MDSCAPSKSAKSDNKGGGGAEGFHNLRSIEGKSVTSRYHGSKFSGSQQYGASMLHSRGLRVE